MLGSSVPDPTASIMSPLTVMLTEEQFKLKQKQIKEKAPPPGAAKILTRARKEQKKQQQQHTQSPTIPQQAPIPQSNTKQEVIQKSTAKPAQNQNNFEESLKSKTSQLTFSTNRSKVNTDRKIAKRDNSVRNSDEEWQNLLDDQIPGIFVL
jgi:hypothetical protein